MTAGRPTKYTDEMPQRARDYLAGCVQVVSDYTKTSGEHSSSYQRLVKVNLPKIEGLALYLQVNKSTIYEWAKTHEDFSDVLDDILKEQEDRLIEGGLNGDFSPVITKLVLSARHDYREKTETKIEGTLNISTEKREAISDALEEVIE